MAGIVRRKRRVRCPYCGKMAKDVKVEGYELSKFGILVPNTVAR
jgi:hypothetical protein